MDTILHQENTKNHKRSLALSILIHVLLLILCILPLFTFPIPPPGQEGILVSLGEPDRGEGDAIAEASTSTSEAVEESSSESEAKPEEKAEPQEKPATAQRAVPEKTITDTKAKEVVISEQEKQRQREAELERQRQAKLEEARKKAAAEEARKKAEYEQKKNAYGDLLGSGQGKGNTGTEGNQGDPKGDPNAKALEGVSSGSGMVGGGLGDRGVLYEPKISDSSQKVGRIVVNVCVNSSGNVISSEYTQRGSTTTDADLRALAEKSAREFKFTPSNTEKQCGTITIDFKVK